MGQPGKREVKWTHILFIDDLKVYQESHEILKDVNETIVQASHDTGWSMLWCGEKCENYFRKRKGGASGEDENHGPRSAKDI